ncbi:MAG: Flp family type IVb pilin [Cypionkella sp.]
MLNKSFGLWVRFRENDDGVTLVEYGVALTLATTVGIVLLTLLGEGVDREIAVAAALLQ